MRTFSFLLALIEIMLVLPLSAGLGFAPATVDVKDVLKGGYAKVSFTVTNTENVPAEFSVKMTGPAAEWAAVYPSNVFTVAARETQKIELIIQPPSDADRETYQANVIVETTIPSSITGQTLTKIRAGIEGKMMVSLTSQQILSVAVNSIETTAVEEGTPTFLRGEIQNNGNVRASPEVIVRLVDARNNIVSERKAGQEILPTESRKIKVQLPTEGLATGEYDLQVSVVLDGKQIAYKALRQRILKKGQLSNPGEIISVDAPAWAEAGSFIKVGVLFKNTGSLLSTAEIVGDFIDGKKVELLSSKPVKVSPGEQIMLYAFFKPQRAGRHSVRVSVLFGGKQTEFTETVVNVTSPTSAASANDSLYYSIALMVIVAGLGYAFRDRLPEVRIEQQGGEKRGRRLFSSLQKGKTPSRRNKGIKNEEMVL